MSLLLFFVFLFFFFFQAEDGIRDSSVTGVQTCALPIYYGFRNSTAGCSPCDIPFREQTDLGSDVLPLAVFALRRAIAVHLRRAWPRLEVQREHLDSDFFGRH